MNLITYESLREPETRRRCPYNQEERSNHKEVIHEIHSNPDKSKES